MDILFKLVIMLIFTGNSASPPSPRLTVRNAQTSDFFNRLVFLPDLNISAIRSKPYESQKLVNIYTEHF